MESRENYIDSDRIIMYTSGIKYIYYINWVQLLVSPLWRV